MLEPSAESGKQEHIKALDGLRGAAIVMVLLHHFMPYRATSFLPARMWGGLLGLGWTGVDLFFVLSGFLITGILYDAKGKERYFRDFYARRTLRIFPLYYGMILLCTVILPRLGIEKGAAPVGGSWWWWLYLSNVRSTFLPNAPMGWLPFFWSLAIEEHFYLVWPAIIYLLSRRAAIGACIVCIAIAWASRAAFIMAGNKYAPYMLTPCRMDALASGAIVALAARGPKGIAALLPKARWLGAASGALLLIVAFWRHSICWDPIMQMIGYPLVDTTYACLLVLAAAPIGAKAARSLFELPMLRMFGKYSYGIYVFQAAVVALIGSAITLPIKLFSVRFERANDGITCALLSMATLIVAMASWHLYEKHFLRLRRYFQYGNVPRRSATGGREQVETIEQAAMIAAPPV